jgi:hypothetical protein
MGKFGRSNNPFTKNHEAWSDHLDLLYFQGNDNRFTYGDICGLAADHSVDGTQLETSLFPKDNSFLDGQSFSLYKALDADVANALLSHYEGIERFEKQGDYSRILYLILAGEDRSHFQRPPKSVLEMLSAIDPALIQAVQEFKMINSGEALFKENARRIQQEMDARFLHLTNTAKYALLHLIALDITQLAAVSYRQNDLVQFDRDLSRAFLINAFADHFLQDAFAGGHLPVKRNNNWLDNNGIHDYYSRVGLKVSNENGDTWHTYGDNFYDFTTNRYAIAANVVSIQEVWDRFQRYINTADLGAWGDTRFTEMRKGRIPSSDWPDRLKSEFRAFKLTPIPLDKAAYKQVDLKRGSKNGAFYEAGYSFGTDGQQTVHAALGAGFCVKKPASVNVRRESDLWAGPGFEYVYRVRPSTDRERWQVKLLSTWWDKLALEFGLGSEKRNGGSHFAGSACAGVEFKFLRFRVAPSVKYALDYCTDRVPCHNLRLAFRFY